MTFLYILAKTLLMEGIVSKSDLVYHMLQSGQIYLSDYMKYMLSEDPNEPLPKLIEFDRNDEYPDWELAPESRIVNVYKDAN